MSNLKRLKHLLVTKLNLKSSISEDEPLWVTREEPIESYRPGGFCPVVVGDVLGNDHRVVRKLGWGVYSTVWLVQTESSTPSYRALKLLEGNALDTERSHELEILEAIRQRSHLHSSSAYVVNFLESFYQPGPSGKHLCIVMEPLSESLEDFSGRWMNCRLPAVFLKIAVRQVLLGIQFLHDECKIIHTGGRPVTRTRSRPIRYPVPEGDVDNPDTWRKVEVRLADFGAACWADKISEHATDMISSPALRAPEVCIGFGWGRPVDIWSLGCTLYELAIGQPLFPRDILPQSVPYLQCIVIGNFPPEMIKKGKYSSSYFDKDGKLNVDLPQESNLREIIKTHPPCDNAEIFVDFLECMLTMDPAKRATPGELLARPWLEI